MRKQSLLITSERDTLFDDNILSKKVYAVSVYNDESNILWLSSWAGACQRKSIMEAKVKVHFFFFLFLITIDKLNYFINH